MNKPVQQRTLKTRARLTDAASELIKDKGYGALRVEDVVKAAGVAKGTFFAHFRDKDALMDQLIGARLLGILEDLAQADPPRSPEEITDRLMPLAVFMMSERYVFDLILRYSGAAAVEEVGPISVSFGRQLEVIATWVAAAKLRPDLPVEMAAEGIQAFLIHALATEFCALHNSASFEDRLRPYLCAWLHPAATSPQ